MALQIFLAPFLGYILMMLWAMIIGNTFDYFGTTTGNFIDEWLICSIGYILYVLVSRFIKKK
jgi:hypothetical protein|tara:strand:+ start:188 stop:373 length:186 start_codon:yes stop_codon:yes gene_type:complete